MLAGFDLELLAARHRRAEFECSSASLNLFIREHAKRLHKNDTSRVYVYADAAGRVAGFFTLSASSLNLSDLPHFVQKGRGRYPVPATLLGRFAVDNEFVRLGVGRFLLARALHIAYAASAAVASAAVALEIAEDASSGAEALYRSVGFVSLPSNPRRMLLPMADIAENMPKT